MNKKWWKAAGIRAIRTVAQTAIATIGTAAVMQDVNWIVFYYSIIFLPALS